MSARRWFSFVKSSGFANNLYAVTNANPRFFFPFGTLYCKTYKIKIFVLNYIKKKKILVILTFANHFETSGISLYLPEFVKSLTISGNTDINSLFSCLLTTLPVTTGGIAVDCNVDNSLKIKEVVLSIGCNKS